jgi:hypothetical protein
VRNFQHPVPPLDRREFVRGLGIGALGLSVPQLFGLPGVSAGGALPGRAKRCIVIFLFGGPSQLDTWDMKPHAPLENRGIFSPIATTVPGIQVCEHLPLTARMMEHIALVRSVSMAGRVIGNGDHHADSYYMLTGHRPDPSFFAEGINRKPHGDDWPFVGSTFAARVPRDPELPAVVQLPARSGEVTGYVNPGQFCGKVGPEYEPVMVRGNLENPRTLSAPQFALPADMGQGRLERRGTLLQRLDQWQERVEKVNVLDTYLSHEQRALSLLTSQKSKRAFDISREPEHVRARYGNDINSQSMLMARRLIEAGIPMVAVHWIGHKVGAGLSWDTHSDNFNQLKNVLLPPFDMGFSALLTDLHERGLLDETLVLVNAEMGRTPKIGDPRPNGRNGRDHWVNCLSVLFAGGGIRGGQVYGASDAIAAYPATTPVYPENIAATVYEAAGIRHHLMHRDREGRPINLAEEAEPLPLL